MAIDGAVNHGQYDPQAMPWKDSQHRDVLDEVSRIQQRLSNQARKLAAAR